MPDLKNILSDFERKTGLKIEKFFEHRSIEWPEKKENLLVFKVSGKRHPAFILFDDSGIKLHGYIVPCARYGLENDD